MVIVGTQLALVIVGTQLCLVIAGTQLALVIVGTHLCLVIAGTHLGLVIVGTQLVLVIYIAGIKNYYDRTMIVLSIMCTVQLFLKDHRELKCFMTKT